ncbi:unnamed protein product [Ectocarpus sp. CCAP 1310/34]|nr:unnamed protein product [Ectocarpus sp. CCAP 1310/34]
MRPYTILWMYLAGTKEAGVVKLPGAGRLMLMPTAADPREG